MKRTKGEAGYLRAQKRKLLLWTVIEFALVIAVFVLGYTQTGSRMNLLTVVAVVGCLPASKMLVEFIAIAPNKSVDEGKYKEILEHSKGLVTAFDLVITSKEKIMQVDALALAENVVCGYTSNPKTDQAKAAAQIKETLLTEHIEKVTVKVFHDYTAFLSRVEGMSSIAQIDGQGTGKREEHMKDTILTTSM